MRTNPGTGTVSTTERWFDEIRRGRAFALGTLAGPTAANISHVQLFNPVASLVTIIVYAVWHTENTLSTNDINTHNVALTTLVGNGVNLLSGGAAASGELRTQDNAVQLGTRFATLTLNANDARLFILPWLIELGAGKGVLVTHRVVNQQLSTTFFWIEI